MSGHRVAELCLRIRASERSTTDLRRRAEHFARAVLDRCTDLLEARVPGRFVFVRQLPLHWRLSEPALDSTAALERCATAAAAAITEAARTARSPSADDDVAVFEDEAHWRAQHLRDLQRGGAGAWLYASLEGAGDPVEVLCAPERRDLALGVLARLAAEDALIAVLAALPAAQSAALAQALGVFPLRAERRPAASGQVEETPPPTGIGAPSIRVQLDDFARILPGTLSIPALLLALYVQARAFLAPTAAEETVRAAVRAAFSALKQPSQPTLAASIPRTTASPGLPESFVAPSDGVTHPPSIIPSGEESPGAATVESPAESVHRTRFGGLFYLLTCALELDVGELLWKACLPEGDVLAHVAAALLGSDAAADPAPSLFGGVEPGRPFPPLASEQQQEIAAALVAALAGALPRRGLAGLPEIMLDLVSHATGRLLVAAAPGSPFVLFAWPASTPSAVVHGLRTFLRAWPTRAPPLYARPALAGLDDTARFRPRLDARVSRDILLPGASSPAVAALLALTAGALCGLFASRTETLASVEATTFVQRYLALPARVTVKADEMAILLPAESIDMDVRRAGLDRDPGWVPWLHRRVRFSFEDQAGEATS
jgi:hypothetical protein